MALYLYDPEIEFQMEPLQGRFGPRFNYWNRRGGACLEDFFEHEDSEIESSASEDEEEIVEIEISESSENEEENEKASNIHVNENMEEMNIKIELTGYQIKCKEDLQAQVIDDCILMIKINDFRKEFQLPAKSIVDQIQTVFHIQEKEDKQSIEIKIPKAINSVQLPITLKED